MEPNRDIQNTSFLLYSRFSLHFFSSLDDGMRIIVFHAGGLTRNLAESTQLGYILDDCLVGLVLVETRWVCPMDS